MEQMPFKIHLLGPVEIKFDDKPVKIRRRVERAILYFLATEHKAVSRTKLIDFLWPDGEQTDPRASLRTALSRLRRELPDPDLIVTKLDQVTLNPDRCEIDVEAFENHYYHLKNILTAYHSDATLPATIVDQIEQSLDLWRGNTFISGDNLLNYPAVENWRQSINRKLNHDRKFLISRLAEHYQHGSKPEKALTLFMLLGRMDTSDVSSQCAALDLLINLGHHQDANNYCDTLESIYEREYGAPLPDEILFRCQQAQYRLTQNQDEEKNQWPIPLTMQLQLIGRHEELQQLQQAFFKGGIVSLQGELGSGKTRLVQELFQTLSPKPFLMLAPSREMEKSLPFSPIIHCMRHSLPDHIWEEIDPVWINHLTVLLPELSRLTKTEPQTSMSQLPEGKQHIYEGLQHICQHITKKYRRILFFLDDAHWADFQTLQALSYIMSDASFAKHGLLVMASRPEETNRDLESMINQSFRSNAIQIIKLQGLTKSELENLAKQVTNTPPPEAFISKLFQETNGNPFLAIEIIRDILESQGNLNTEGDAGSLPLPTSVHKLIQKRLLHLDELERHVLLCAAVLGNILSLDLLKSVAEMPPSSLAQILDRLLKSGLIQSTKNQTSGKAQLYFSHEIMREVILKEASDFQLQIFYRQTAQQMASDPQYRDKANVIANYFLSSGDEKQAFKWFLMAANHAWDLGSVEDAQNAYLQVEKLLENDPETITQPGLSLMLYQQWSDFAYESNQIELVEQLGAKLQHIGGRVNHPLLIGMSQVILSNACFLRHNFQTGLDLINSAIEYISIADDNDALIKAIKRKGVISWWTMDFAEVETSARQVLEMCQYFTLNEDLRISMEFNAKHLLNMMQYTYGHANTAFQTAQWLYNQYFHKLEAFDRLRSLYLLSYSSLISAEFGKCEQFTKKALELARPLGAGILEEINLVILSKAELVQGKLDQAYQHGLQALHSAERTNNTSIIVAANCILGDILYAVKNVTAAAQYYRVGQIREGLSNVSFYGIENKIHLAHLLAWTGQISEARQILHKCLDYSEKFKFEQYYADEVLVCGYCDFHESKLGSAEEKFNKAILLTEANGLLLELSLGKLSLARLLMAKKENAAARKLLNESLEISQQKNMAWQIGYGLELSMRLDKINHQSDLLNQHQSAYQDHITRIKENMQSEALRKEFSEARKVWDQEHHFPS
jgi:predicted ATPase